MEFRSISPLTRRVAKRHRHVSPERYSPTISTHVLLSEIEYGSESLVDSLHSNFSSKEDALSQHLFRSSITRPDQQVWQRFGTRGQRSRVPVSRRPTRQLARRSTCQKRSCPLAEVDLTRSDQPSAALAVSSDRAFLGRLLLAFSLLFRTMTSRAGSPLKTDSHQN